VLEHHHNINLSLSGMWDRYPAIGDGWMRTRERPPAKAAIADRMTSK